MQIGDKRCDFGFFLFEFWENYVKTTLDGQKRECITMVEQKKIIINLCVVFYYVRISLLKKCFLLFDLNGIVVLHSVICKVLLKERKR
jgi:hypothetical protein